MFCRTLPWPAPAQASRLAPGSRMPCGGVVGLQAGQPGIQLFQHAQPALPVTRDQGRWRRAFQRDALVQVQYQQAAAGNGSGIDNDELGTDDGLRRAG